jgi:hypothetical protein
VAQPGVRLSGCPLMVRHTCGTRNTRLASVITMAADFVDFIFVILNYNFMRRIFPRPDSTLSCHGNAVRLTGRAGQCKAPLPWV